VVALLGVIGAEFAFSMRLEASAARAYKESITGAHLAEAAVAQAMRELAGDFTLVGPSPEDGELAFFTREKVALPRLPRADVALGEGRFRYRISDEEGRININVARAELIDRLLQGLGLEKRDRDVINDSIQDWRDGNDEHRANGAESDDYYLTLPVPYRARNGNLESIGELLQVRGITPVLMEPAEKRPGLADLLTVRSQGQVNINTAPEAVLRAIGLSEAEIGSVVQDRLNGPYVTVPGNLTGRQLITGSRTFRIEAEGLLDGQPRARVTAIVQKRGDAANPAIIILEWSGIR
jgi:general secretion pathway protein K